MKGAFDVVQQSSLKLAAFEYAWTTHPWPDTAENGRAKHRNLTAKSLSAGGTSQMQLKWMTDHGDVRTALLRNAGLCVTYLVFESLFQLSHVCCSY